MHIYICVDCGDWYNEKGVELIKDGIYFSTYTVVESFYCDNCNMGVQCSRCERLINRDGKPMVVQPSNKNSPTIKPIHDALCNHCSNIYCDICEKENINEDTIIKRCEQCNYLMVDERSKNL